MANATLVNFAAGETSPQSRGRFDLEWFQASCRKLVNWIAEVAGAARYRTGFRRSADTRAGAVARLVPFQLNDSQAYMLEFTAGKLRVYKGDTRELLTIYRTTITGITRASPAVITVAATTGLANDDEVIITGLVGMVELNGRQVKLANNSGSTYELVDPTTGTAIDSSAFGAWSSGGSVAEVYEIAAPYLAGELDDIQWAQSNTTGYLVHPRYAPYKLTVDSSEAFTLATYSRTSDPFAAGAALTVTGIYLSTTTVVTFSAGSVIDYAAVYTFASVVGTTQVNGNSYRLERAYTPGGGSVSAYLVTVAGADIDSSAWTAYVSGGTATPDTEHPLSVGFYEGRLGFFGTNQRPNTLFLSRGPDATGNPRYDDFTGGADADHACFFSLAPASGQVDYAAWMKGSDDYLFLGTFGGPFRAAGTGVDEAITPSSINVRQVDLVGCEAVVPTGGARIFFIQRGGTTVRSIRYNPDTTKLESYDMCINAEHIAAESRLTRVALQSGRPDVLWVCRADGVLAGMTVNGSENVAGWHRHQVGGTDAKVIDVATLGRPDDNDQLWAVVERTVGGTTRRTVEVLADGVVFRDLEDLFDAASTAATAAADSAKYVASCARRAEACIHADGAGTYDGSDRGVDAGATLTPFGGYTFTDFTYAADYAAGDIRATGPWARIDFGGGKTLGISHPYGAAVPLLQVEVATNSSDDLDVTRAGVTAVILLANSTASKNSAANIQAGLRALTGGYSVAGILVAGSAAYVAAPPIAHDLEDIGFYSGSVHVASGAVSPAILFPLEDPTNWSADIAASTTLIASAAVFAAADVGAQVWKKADPDTGVGAGKLTITTVVSSKVVLCTAVVALDSATAAIAAGDWYITAAVLTNLWHLEGERVAVVTDGTLYSDGKTVTYPTVTVASGKITLSAGAAVVHVGLPYDGILQTQNLEMGGRSGPAQSKPRNIASMDIRFLNSSGCQFGTDLYNLQVVPVDTEVFSGVKHLPYSDRWESTEEKTVFVVQRLPLPAVVQFIDVRYATGEEGGEE